ncbi:MAG: ATP-binding protein [Synechococcales cyanobacterium]
MFDRFYPIHSVPSCSKGKGSGLGLAIVRAIVDNHHGQIEVESQLNKGTMFVVTLPTE